jgi:hypothetical protein
LTRHKAAGDRASSDAYRLLDSGPLLVARHSRNKIEPGRDRLRQIAKPRTVADEVGAHRQRDIYRHLRLPRRLKDKLYKRGVIPGLAGGADEPEDFLELVDDDEKILGFWKSRQANYFDEAKAAAPQPHLEQCEVPGCFLLARVCSADHIARVQRFGKIADGVFAGPKNCDTPL